MGRRGSFIVVIVLVAGISTLIWFMQRSSRNFVADPYSLVPPDAYFFIESDDLPGFLNSVTGDNRLFAELEKVKGLEKSGKKIIYLRDFINRNDISGFFEKNQVVISFHPSANGSLVPLLSMSIPASAGYKNIIRSVGSAAGGRLFEHRIDGLRIYSVPYTVLDQPDTLFVAFKSGLILSCTSSTLLKKTISGVPSGTNIRSMPGLQKIMNAAGKNEDKFFIVFRNFAELLKRITAEQAPELSESFARLAGSTEGDIYINENSIILSGYTESVDRDDLIYKFKSQQAGELNTVEVLPSSVVLFETMLLDGRKVNNQVPQNIDDSTRSLAIKLLPFTGDEITKAIVTSKEDSEQLNTIVFLELKNRIMAEQLVNDKITEWATKLDLREDEYIDIFQPDDQTKIPVYRTPFRNITSVLLPGFVKPSEDSLVAFIDNFMVTGSSYSVISKVLYDNILKKTLINDLAYRDFESTMPSRAGYYFYCVPSGIIGHLSAFFNKEIIEILNANEGLLRKIPAVGYRLASSNEMIYNTLSVKFGEEIREDSGADWETLLDAVASIKPFFFTNHSTGAKEIFIQDNKNNAYLVNSAGRVLWKIALNERIYGPVYMIDFYRNGKYQLLFAGKNWLHLIDRNGNYVERYPVRLRAAASGPPSLFDYDGNNEYRILIPGEDKLIYAYDKTGSVVKGWKPFMTSGVVKSGIKFFRVSGKDYIVAADNSTLYFLDRTGNIRLKLKTPVLKAAGSEIRLNSGRESSLVFSSPEGAVQMVTFDGNVRNFDLGRFSVDHLFDFFDVDGDGFGEYLFIDKGILYLYDNDRSLVFKKDFGTESLEGPISFVFSASDRKIGVLDSKKKLIYLIDNKGNTMNGFPLRGASVFSIGKLSDKSGFHLIVGGDDNFLYNYKLNTESN